MNLIDGLTIEQLNEIPTGYNNNIIWNLAHLLSAQQSICYTRAGLTLQIDEKLFLNYKPGTKPQNFVEGAEIDIIKESFLTAIDQLNLDIQNNVFATYPTWSTAMAWKSRQLTMLLLLFFSTRDYTLDISWP